MVKSNVGDSHMFQAWWTIVIRANYCNTETWIRKCLTQFFPLTFLNHYSIEDHFVDNPISVAPHDFKFEQFADE